MYICIYIYIYIYLFIYLFYIYYRTKSTTWEIFFLSRMILERGLPTKFWRCCILLVKCALYPLFIKRKGNQFMFMHKTLFCNQHISGKFSALLRSVFQNMLNSQVYYLVHFPTCICGVARNTRRSGCTVAALLISSYSHFRQF